MHDFRCTNAKDMHVELMAETTRYYKETPKGVSTMSKAMEERLKENSYLCSIDFASKLLMKGDYTFDVIAELTGLPLEDVQELAAEQENSEQN